MKLKICGMTRQEDINCAMSLGYDFCGFIFHPRSPRHIAPERAARLETGPMRRVGVFVDQTGSRIVEIMRIARLDYAQLHGAQTEADTDRIGAESVIRVLWPDRYPAVTGLEEEAAKMRCAFFLLDAGKSGGGSGQALAWSDLATLALPAPWFLAGGLDCDNIRAALARCSPDGLDFNSGLELAPGQKCVVKMGKAARVAREAR